MGMSPYESESSRGLNAAVAATLNGERVAAGMTFDQLAERTGMSKQTLMRLLSTRKRHLTIAAVAAIAEAFGMSVPDVFAHATERMRRPGAIDPATQEAARVGLQKGLGSARRPPEPPRDEASPPKRVTRPRTG